MRHPKHQTCPVPLAYSPFTRENLRSCCSALFFFSNTGNGKAIGLKISRCCKGCTVLSCGDVRLGDARPLGKFVPEFPSTAPVLQLYAQQSPRPKKKVFCFTFTQSGCPSARQPQEQNVALGISPLCAGS